MFRTNRLAQFTLIAVTVLLSAIYADAQLSTTPPKIKAQSPTIAATEWVGIDDGDVTTFLFEKGGTLSYSYNGSSYRNGTWTQDGTAITFEMNKNYRSFIGTLEQDSITGTSENTTGKKWGLTIYRYRHPVCGPEQFVVGSDCRSARVAAPDAAKGSKKAKPKSPRPQKNR